MMRTRRRPLRMWRIRVDMQLRLCMCVCSCTETLRPALLTTHGRGRSLRVPLHKNMCANMSLGFLHQSELQSLEAYWKYGGTREGSERDTRTRTKSSRSASLTKRSRQFCTPPLAVVVTVAEAAWYARTVGLCVFLSSEPAALNIRPNHADVAIDTRPLCCNRKRAVCNCSLSSGQIGRRGRVN